MFEREIGVPGKVSEHPAPMPTASKARVEGETPVDQPDCGIDILAGSTENEGSDGENVGVVGAGSERSSSKIDARAPVRLVVIRPAIVVEPHVAIRCMGKGGPIMGITLDRPTEQVERKRVLVPLLGKHVWEGT
jgi:hypothetical protein